MGFWAEAWAIFTDPAHIAAELALPDRPGDAFVSAGDAVGFRIMAEAGVLPEEITLKKQVAEQAAHLVRRQVLGVGSADGPVCPLGRHAVTPVCPTPGGLSAAGPSRVGRPSPLRSVQSLADRDGRHAGDLHGGARHEHRQRRAAPHRRPEQVRLPTDRVLEPTDGEAFLLGQPYQPRELPPVPDGGDPAATAKGGSMAPKAAAKKDDEYGF